MPDTLADILEAKRSLPSAPMRRAIRETAGVSLATIGELIDPPVSAEAVRSWERGTRRPRPAHLVQYARIVRQLRDLS